MKKNITYLWIVLFASLILIPFTGNVHLFDWDEINFAECAREMIVTDTYHTPLLNYQAFWEKPPLFIWMQVLSMKLFGINEFAARFPNIFNGIITLCLLYYLGKKWYHHQFGILWALVHLGTILPHLYFRSGIIDPWYNLFGFIFFVGVIEYLQHNNFRFLLIGSIALGLSVLTKGPAMLVITGLSAMIILLLNKNLIRNISFAHILIAFLIFILTGGSWFLYEFLSGNYSIIQAFVDYQIRLFKTEDSGHGGFFLYHFIVILLGCFPASVLMFKYFSKNISGDFYSKSMLILLLVVLVIFSIVKTKIVHYSSMSYYAVSFLTTYVLTKDNKLNALQKSLLLILSSIIGILLILAASIEKWKYLIIPYLEKSDVFSAQNLSVQVKWYGWEWLSGLFFILIIWWYVFSKEYSLKKSIILFGLLVIWIDFTLNNFVGKVEQYSQNAAITFFEWCGEKNYLVDTYGYKSYAYLFYGKRVPPLPNQKSEIDNQWQALENAGYEKIFSYNLAYLNWLIYSEQYPAFLVCKIQDEKNLENTGKFKKLYSKGGYVFFMKLPPLR